MTIHIGDFGSGAVGHCAHRLYSIVCSTRCRPVLGKGPAFASRDSLVGRGCTSEARSDWGGLVAEQTT